MLTESAKISIHPPPPPPYTQILQVYLSTTSFIYVILIEAYYSPYLLVQQSPDFYH